MMIKHSGKVVDRESWWGGEIKEMKTIDNSH